VGLDSSGSAAVDLGNDALTDLAGLLNNVTNVDNVYIGFNDNLAALTGLESLTAIGDTLALIANPELDDIAALNNVDDLGAQSAPGFIDGQDNVALDEADLDQIVQNVQNANGVPEQFFCGNDNSDIDVCPLR